MKPYKSIFKETFINTQYLNKLDNETKLKIEQEIKNEINKFKK